MSQQSDLPNKFISMGEFILATMRNSMLTSQFIGLVENSIDYLLQFVDIYPLKSKEDIKRFKYARTYWEEDFGGACRQAKQIFHEALQTRNPLEILSACGKCLEITTSGIVKFCSRYPYLTATSLSVVRLALAGTLFAFAPFSTLVIAGMSFGPSFFAGTVYTALHFIQKAIFRTPKENEQKMKEQISAYTKTSKEMLTDIDEQKLIEMLNTKHKILKELDKVCTQHPDLKNSFHIAEALTKIQINLNKNLEKYIQEIRAKKLSDIEEKINKIETVNLKNAERIKLEADLEKYLKETVENLHKNPLSLIGLGLTKENIINLAAKEDIKPFEFSEFIDLADEFQYAYNSRTALSQSLIINAINLSDDPDKENLINKVVDTFQNYRENFDSHENSLFTEKFDFYQAESKKFRDLANILAKTKNPAELLKTLKTINHELRNSPLGSCARKLADDPIAKELGIIELDQLQKTKSHNDGTITPKQHQESLDQQEYKNQVEKLKEQIERKKILEEAKRMGLFIPKSPGRS